MTPEQLTGLAALLCELREWIRDNWDGPLDVEMVDAVIEICALYRTLLVREGAQ